MMDYGKNNNQPFNPQGGAGWNLYSYSFFFCSNCVQNVPPAVAIKSFLNVQNVLDILQLLGLLSQAFKAGGGVAAGFYGWIVLIILALVLSFLGRSELNVVGAKGSWPIGKVKFALIIYLVLLILEIIAFSIVIFILATLTIFASSASKEGGAAMGFIGIIFLLVLLPFILLTVAQLVQCCRMKDAANEIEGNGALNSTM